MAHSGPTMRISGSGRRFPAEVYLLLHTLPQAPGLDEGGALLVFSGLERCFAGTPLIEAKAPRLPGVEWELNLRASAGRCPMSFGGRHEDSTLGARDFLG